MPGNIVVINDGNELSFYVGDSKMEGLIEYLNKIGYKENDQSEAEVKDNRPHSKVAA